MLRIPNLQVKSISVRLETKPWAKIFNPVLVLIGFWTTWPMDHKKVALLMQLVRFLLNSHKVLNFNSWLFLDLNTKWNLFSAKAHSSFHAYLVGKWATVIHWELTCNGLVSSAGEGKDSHPFVTIQQLQINTSFVGNQAWKGFHVVLNQLQVKVNLFSV